MSTKFTDIDGVEIKVGQGVLVVKAGVTLDPNGMGKGIKWQNSWIVDMRDRIGKTEVIKSIDVSGVQFDGSHLGYPSNILRIIPEEKQFGIADLKEGMRVVTRNKKNAVVFIAKNREAEIVAIAYISTEGVQTGWDSAHFADESLVRKQDYFAIEEVYAAPYVTQHFFLLERGKLLWKNEDEEFKKMKKILEDKLAEATATVIKAKDEHAISVANLAKHINSKQ